MHELKWIVIGYGSPLRSDDRFGLCVADALRDRLQDESVQVLAVHQLLPELAENLSRSAGAVFIDATIDLPPGVIKCVTVSSSDSTAGQSLTHQVTPESLLQKASSLYGRSPAAWLFSIGGETFEIGESLSPMISNMVQKASELIEEHLRLNPELMGDRK